jgi:glucan phosphoethanolaminetransferase (alkaline phosphatase superfamily)
MFKKLSKHLLLAAIFFVLTLTQQYGFYYLKGYPLVWLSLGKYFGVYAFLFVATFIRPYPLRYIFLGFILLLNFFQMAHLSWFGTQILPNEYILMLTQFHEIRGTLWVEYHHVIIPLLFTVIPAVIGWLSVKKTRGLFGSKIIGILFCLYFIYNPVRTFVTGNTWGRQPSNRELAGMNVYLSFSYFVGKILPHKIANGINENKPNASTELFLSEGQESDWDAVIVVLGESLTPHHMSLYGYERPTTPFLLTQLDNPNFFHTIALSGGVSTDIAVAFLLNMGFGEAGSTKAAKGYHCLFKLAKEKHFSTSFLSIQSADQLRYIAPYLCAASLDSYQTLEDIAPTTKDHQAALDADLLSYFEKIVKFDKKQFIILHQRGSHSPWGLRSRPEKRVFPHDATIDQYDNSVIEFDHFMQEFNRIASASGKKILMVYLSDHGEALGQDGKWGHGLLIPAAFEIPLIIQSFNHDLPTQTRMIPKFIPHYNVSLYLAEALGFKPSQNYIGPVKNYEVFGNDIDGFAGKAEISFKPDGTYDYKVSN